ncbi:MAG: TIGR03960 family B12-binding radical SAM protein [Clostridiales bacterium]|nr:TIGR03960 family B12-binding radical SAM protein [Clostridiales bacterium]
MKQYPVPLSKSDLMSVESPARYVGGEFNAVIKEDMMEEIEKTGRTDYVRFAFCFPDIYEIGMSNLALQILYHVLNESDFVACERAFSPWLDMDKILREKNIPLYSQETKTPLCDFDILGFTLGYEMCYTNVLQMMDLGKIPLLAKDRGEDDPVICCGGPCAYNIEPMADFFDIAMMGEGEEMILELSEKVREYKLSKKTDHPMTRQELLLACDAIEGIYVPSLYEVSYSKEKGADVKPLYEGVKKEIKKRIITDLDTCTYPTAPVVSNLRVVHDRSYLEVFRGCIRGCRFCQAGFIYRPVREKSVEVLCEQGRQLEQNTGYDEMGLLSLATSDYTRFPELAENLLTTFEGHHTSLSLPSLRLDSFSLDLMEKVQSTRKSGLTFAPEAGTQRLRDVINKNIREEDIFSALRLAFMGGWSTVKLYFMLGLPTETDEDVLGIADLAKRIEKLYYDVGRETGQKMRRPDITVSTSLFIPKPFTPFQWEPQNTKEELIRKQHLLKDNMRSRNIRYAWHDFDSSVWEVVLARGDRRLGPVLLEGYQSGLFFDAWDDHFNFGKWVEILNKHGLTIEDFSREFSDEETLPWDHVSVGVNKKFLLSERHNAHEEKTTPSCREHCSGCGAATWGVGECFAKRNTGKEGDA